MKMNKKIWGVLAAVATLGLSGCYTTTSSSYLTNAWYDVYGNYCGSLPGPGCDFYWDGSKITYSQDPYVAPLTYYTNLYYTDVYGFTRIFNGWGYWTADNLLFDEWGNCLNEADDSTGNDMITNALAAQKAAINGAAQGLQAKYGLDANVAFNIANGLNDWAVLGKSRKRTEADVAAFTKRLTGLDIGDINAAMDAASKGDMGAADQAITKAAKNWSTSPDTMKQIMKDWFSGQANGSN